MKNILWISTLLLTLLLPRAAWAHNLLVQATVLNDAILVEAFYDDETSAKAALVDLMNGDQRIAEGKTDGMGTCRLPRPEAGDYEILVNAGAGHRRKVSVHVPAIVPSATEPKSTPPQPPPTRAKLTRYPWEGVAAGLGCIALLAIGYWSWRKLKSS